MVPFEHPFWEQSRTVQNSPEQSLIIHMSQEELSILDPDNPNADEVPPAPVEGEAPIARVSPCYWYSGYVLFERELDEDELWHIAMSIEEYLEVNDTTGVPQRGPVDFLKGQFEVSASGQLHFQYIAHFPNKVRPPAVIAWWNRFPYVSIVRQQRVFNLRSMLNYVEKLDTRLLGPFEWGICPQTGRSSELVLAISMIQRSQTFPTVARSAPLAIVQNYRGLRQLQQLLLAPEDQADVADPPEVVLYYGPTGAGKSHAARGGLPVGFRTYVIPVGTGLWFDNYEGQEHVIFDEYHGQFPLDQLLRLLDGYYVQVPYKGGHCWYHPRRVSFTSTTLPGEWYNYNRRLDRWSALKRRITTLALCTVEPRGVEYVAGDDLVREKSMWVPRLQNIE